MSSFRCSWALTVSLAVLLPAASLLRSGEEEPGLVGYWGFETGSGVGVSDGQPAWGISPLDASLPQPLAHWNFDTIEGEAVADGQGAVGVVDDTAGHADGPFHGFAVDPASLNEGLNYSADVPAALALSASSLEIDEASGVVEFFSIPANDAFANITTGDFTLHAWFQSTDGGRGVILGAYPEGANARMSLELHTGNRLRFWVNGPDGTADLNVTLADPSRDGLWHVATAVRRGDMHELWFDGVMVGSRENNAGNFVQSAPTMYFGRDGRVGATRFGGKLDDIAMWGEALTVPQIEVLAAGGSPLAGAGLAVPVLCFEFETAEGIAVGDGDLAVGQIDETSGDVDGPYHGTGVGALGGGLPTYEIDFPAGPSGTRASLLFVEALGGISNFSVPMSEPIANLTMGDFTFHSWFKTTDEGRGVLFGTCCTAGNSRISLELHTANRLRFYVNGPTATTDLNVTLPAPSRDGKWHVATAVRRGATHELWFDGEMVGSRENTAGAYALAPGEPMFFGRDARTGATQFDGQLDQVTFWDLAIDAEDIVALATQGRVDEAAGHVGGPYPGSGSGPAPAVPESPSVLRYSEDAPAALTGSTHSIEFDESAGDQSFQTTVEGSLASLTEGDFTLQTWFKTTDTGRGGFFGTCCSGAAGRVNFELHTGNRLRLWLNGPGATTDLNVTLTPPSRDNEWHHAVALRREGDVEVWFDGVRVGTRADTAGAFTQSRPTMFFGRDERVGSTAFSGKQDDIAFWNVALSAAEIAALFGGDSPLDGTSPAPVVYYAFETTEGAAVADGEHVSGQVDETSGDASGPYHGTGNAPDAPPPPPDGLTYSDDTPAVLADSLFSLEVDETNGDESYSVPMAPAMADLTVGDFSLHAWFKTTDAGRGGILGTCCAGPNSRVNLELHTSNRVRVWINGLTATSDLNVNVDAVGNSRDGAWHSLTAVRRADMVELWFDGELVGERVDVAGSFVQSQPVMFFGRDGRLGATQFSGGLDDIAMWNLALPPALISDLADGVSPPDLVFPTDDPPSAPQKLVAVEEENQVSLDWADNPEEDVTGYNVFRSEVSGGPYASIATSVVDSDYVDTSVVNETEYFYVVTAVDLGENESDPSNEASATPIAPDVEAPLAPTGLAVVLEDDGVIGLDWDDNAEGDLASYQVLRGTSMGGPYGPGPMVTESEYTDTAVTNGTTYYYKVVAIDTSDNVSDPSDEAAGTPIAPDVEAPGAPTGLVAVAGDGVVDLDWDDNTEKDLASYQIFRSTEAGGPYTEGPQVIDSDYSDVGLVNGTTYYYVITATDTNDNESVPSAEASGTPLLPGGLQKPGDCNQDGSTDLSDAVCVFGYLFLGTPVALPCGDGSESDAANVTLLDFNGDLGLDLSDGVSLLLFLFQGGPPHSAGADCVRIVDCPDVCAESGD